MLAGALGASAKTHYLETPLETIRLRLEARNALLPTFNFQIDPALLIGFLGLFEVPSTAEGAEVVVVSEPSAHRPLNVQ
jgi:hypothetical protein